MAQHACRRKIDLLQKTLSGILSEAVTVRIESADRAPAPAAPAAAASKPASPPSAVSRQQRQQALNDPAVQMLLKELNATPLEIHKVEIASNEEALIEQEIEQP